MTANDPIRDAEPSRRPSRWRTRQVQIRSIVTAEIACQICQMHQPATAMPDSHQLDFVAYRRVSVEVVTMLMCVVLAGTLAAAHLAPVSARSDQAIPDFNAELRPIINDLPRYARSKDWITDDDLPPSGMSERPLGTLKARLRISRVGRVDGCKIVVSSGNEVLDERTCRLLSRRARFKRPLTSQQRTYLYEHRWQVPHD